MCSACFFSKLAAYVICKSKDEVFMWTWHRASTIIETRFV